MRLQPPGGSVAHMLRTHALPMPGPIAIANYDLRASGTVMKSIQIASAARAAGLPAQLWVVRATGSLRDRVPAGVPIVETGGWLRLPSRPADLVAAVPGLARALRVHRPSVLLSAGNHLHLSARAALGFSGMRPRVRFGLRVSNSSHHGTIAPWSTARRRLKYSGADFVVAVSDDLAAEVRAQVPWLEVDCIPNGCDAAAVRRQAQVPAQHPFFDAGATVITTMGRVTRQKGFDLLIRALPLLRQHIDARLLVLGTGTAANLTALRRLAARLDVADCVDFAGYLSNPFPLIARSRLYVCASRWEGSSNALLEALACEVPVVATDCPTGNGEILLGGRLGALAEPEDLRSLARAMLAELRTQRDPAEREKQLARLDLGRCVERWCALLGREWQLANVPDAAPRGALT